MTDKQLAAIVEAAGWRLWGKLQQRHHGWYQCCRRGNKYLWIGTRYLERSDCPTAVDYATQTAAHIRGFIERV